MGGAEKAFLDRVLWAPKDVRTKVINTRPDLEGWNLPPKIPSVTCQRKNFVFIFKLRREINSFNPEIVIVRSPIDLIFVAALKLASRNRWKLIYEAHSTKLTNRPMISRILLPFYFWANTQTDLLIAVSRSVADGIQAIGAKKIKIHHLGAQVSLNGDHREELKFLFVGRFVEIKQPILLLQAIKLVREILLDAGVRVVFVGKGPLESQIKDFIRENNLESIVEVKGFVENLNPIYSQSEYLISTSQYEGLPITFFEAKQHGLRIITTPSSGDFDVLASDDVILPDFQVLTLSKALVAAVANGRASSTAREEIQRNSQWMSSEYCANIFYKLIDSELQC